MILAHLLKPEILEMIETGEWNELRSFLMNQPAPEIAELLGTLGRKDSLVVFRLLPRRLAGDVFALLDPEVQNLLIEHLAGEEMRGVLAGLSPDDRTALFEELPAGVLQPLLALLPDAQRREALALLSYPERSVGRLMTTAYVTIRPEWTAEQALEHLRKNGRDSETMAMLYVLDDRGRLVADIPLRRVILAPPDRPLRDLIRDRRGPCLRSMQDREEALAMFKKYDLHALPVVDADEVLLGIVTTDDILDVAAEETTEDFHKLAKVAPIEGSLRRAGIGFLFRKRIGWLLVLVLVNLFSGAALTHFEATIAAVVSLVSFLPLLIGSGGNAGAQTATLIIRAMATGDVRPEAARHLLGRELAVSLCIGGLMASAVFFLGWLRGGAMVGAVVASAMLAVVVFGSLIGLLLPLGLHRLGFDPAAAGTPLIAAVADIGGILIYFSIAQAWLGGGGLS